MVHSSRPQALVRPHPRERRRRETAERIVATAEEIVAGGGCEALTMHHLARVLGYTVGALYRYFPSKEALVLAVLARVLDALHGEWRTAAERVEAHLARSRGTEPEDAALLRLLVALAAYEHFAERHPQGFRLLGTWLGDSGPVDASSAGALLTPSLLAVTRHLRGLLESAAAAGALAGGDARRRAPLLWGALHGAMQMRRFASLGIPDFGSAPLSPELVESLLVAWGARADRMAALQRRAGRLARAG